MERKAAQQNKFCFQFIVLALIPVIGGLSANKEEFIYLFIYSISTDPQMKAAFAQRSGGWFSVSAPQVILEVKQRLVVRVSVKHVKTVSGYKCIRVARSNGCISRLIPLNGSYVSRGSNGSSILTPLLQGLDPITCHKEGKTPSPICRVP